MSDKTRLVGLKRGGDNETLYNKLFVEDSGYRLISSSPKVFSAIHPDDFGDTFYISEDELGAYVEGFIESVKENVDSVITAAVEDTSNNDISGDSALNDTDIKLSLYRSFKSLYDKWISCSIVGTENNSGYFYNNYGSSEPSETRMLYEHFSFVNRCNSDIGKKAVIDFAYLSNLASTKNGQGPTQSLYESLTNLLTKNNFEFFAMPNIIGYSSGKDSTLEDIFRAFDTPIGRVPAKPGFVCMFIGGSSRTLDIPKSYCGSNGINFDYVDDSFDIDKPETYPVEFINSGGVTAFKVRYGQQTQNHFKSLELDQSEFKETQESLLVIDALSNPGSGSNPATIGKGNNIYDVYLTRNYSCTVNTFGNMQIQPMMMFKLENVPMYKGTYLITNVNHTIKPHNVETTFKGVRQPIVTVPIITEALSLVDLALAETLQGDAAVAGTGGAGGAGGTGGAGGATTVPADQIFVDTTVYGDNSNEKCPNISGIVDGGIGDAYIKGKLYKIRLCKVHGALINVAMAENLFNMVNDAQAAGVNLKPGSSFRTMDTQISTAKSNGCYKTGDYVKGDCSPDTATPGYSKHQSGTAIDFTCNGKTICWQNSSEWCRNNGNNPCFNWLEANASKYGFINYKREAWHWSIDGT